MDVLRSCSVMSTLQPMDCSPRLLCTQDSPGCECWRMGIPFSCRGSRPEVEPVSHHSAGGFLGLRCGSPEQPCRRDHMGVRPEDEGLSCKGPASPSGCRVSGIVCDHSSCWHLIMSSLLKSYKIGQCPESFQVRSWESGTDGDRHETEEALVINSDNLPLGNNFCQWGKTGFGTLYEWEINVYQIGHLWLGFKTVVDITVLGRNIISFSKNQRGLFKQRVFRFDGGLLYRFELVVSVVFSSLRPLDHSWPELIIRGNSRRTRIVGW